MIPCKDCLILPACKHKERVYCAILIRWLDSNGRDGVQLLEYLPDWVTISDCVPDHKDFVRGMFESNVLEV
jgi:hypothetical protein